MEDFNLFITLAKNYGPEAAIAMSIVWIHVINPRIKKSKGTFITWRHMKEKLETIEQDYKNLSNEVTRIARAVTAQMEKAVVEERKVDTLEIAQQRFDRDMEEVKYIVRDFVSTQKTTNRLLGEIKDALRQRE